VKVIDVVGEPDPGDAVPPDRTGSSCDAPLQLAPIAAGAPTVHDAAMSASHTTAASAFCRAPRRRPVVMRGRGM
jgi:hypothetical protein